MRPTHVTFGDFPWDSSKFHIPPKFPVVLRFGTRVRTSSGNWDWKKVRIPDLNEQTDENLIRLSIVFVRCTVLCRYAMSPNTLADSNWPWNVTVQTQPKSSKAIVNIRRPELSTTRLETSSTSGENRCGRRPLVEKMKTLVVSGSDRIEVFCASLSVE